MDQENAHSGAETPRLNPYLPCPRHTNGIQLYYEERGTGEPVLLIMGITAPGSVWELHAEFWSGALSLHPARQPGRGPQRQAGRALIPAP